MYPFSLFAKAMNGEAMTPWERANYKFWQYLAATLGVWLLANLSTIEAAFSGTGTNFWEQVHTQILVPFVVALVMAVLKYHSAQTDTLPPPGQPLKIVTSSKRIKALHAGPSDVGNKPASPASPAPAAAEPVAAA
jgi:hypothetical protein